jgi:DNA-binding transcriptional ArsR family regulator
MENNTKIDFFQLKKTALILRALNHKLRQQIFNLLELRGKLTVTDIYVELKLEQSVASQHLAILRTAGIVKTEREGKFVYYKLNHERISQIDSATKQFL